MLMAGVLISCVVNCSDSAMPQHPSKSTSEAIPPTTDSRLRREFAPAVARHGGRSGFRLITTGENAFFTRLALIRNAQHSLDLQYYLIDVGTTSDVFLEEILRAADRGVQVRILLDQLNVKNEDTALIMLNSHPRIAIRGFNPITTEKKPFLHQATAWLTDIGRYNRRMHNKALIADNQAAVTGGRNLGDRYFNARSDFNFSDLDVLAIGPIVPSISRSFDRYWNSKQAQPFEILSLPEQDKEANAKIRNDIEKRWNEIARSPLGEKLQQLNMKDIWEGRFAIVWATADLSADAPGKVEMDENAESQSLNRLDRLLQHADKEFIAVTPYFVPREEGVKWLDSLLQQGLRIRILTNSLASTDVAVVHTGYSRYRETLVKKGLEIYELKPISGKPTRQNLTGSKSGARSSLHSKVYVVDREHVVIGSLNLDPRSIELNTELAIAIHSPQLAGHVIKMFEEATQPSSSYRLTLSKPRPPRSILETMKGGKLIWTTREKGKTLRYTNDPEAGIWRRFVVSVFSFLPIEDQL